jgi:hypothetical protein
MPLFLELASLFFKMMALFFELALLLFDLPLLLFELAALFVESALLFVRRLALLFFNLAPLFFELPLLFFELALSLVDLVLLVLKLALELFELLVTVGQQLFVLGLNSLPLLPLLVERLELSFQLRPAALELLGVAGQAVFWCNRLCMGGLIVEDFQFDRPDRQTVAGAQRRFIERAIVQPSICRPAAHNGLLGTTQNQAMDGSNLRRFQPQRALP